MKSILSEILLLFTIECVALSGKKEDVDTAKDSVKRLEEADAQFLKDGSSMEMLRKYDDILVKLQQIIDSGNVDIHQKLEDAYLKHGTINLALGRDNLATEDFASCISVSEESWTNEKQDCYNQFSRLCKQYGMIDRLTNGTELVSKYLAKDQKIDITNTIKQITDLQDTINSMESSKKYDTCVQECDKLMKISEHSSFAHRKRLNCLLAEEKSNKLTYHDTANMLTDDLRELVMNSGDSQPSDYSKLALLYLFGERSSSILSSRILKTCLKINNDDKQCRKMSKAQIKLSRIMKQVNPIMDYYSVLYDDSKLSSTNQLTDLEPSNEQWEDLKASLFETKQKINFRNGKDRIEVFGFDIDSIPNNFEIILEYMLDSMEEEFGFNRKSILETSEFLHDFFTLAKECHIQTNSWDEAKRDGLLNNKFYKEYLSVRKNRKDLPDEVLKMDILLGKHKFKSFKKVYDMMNERYRKSSMVKQRFGVYSKQRRQYEEARLRQQRNNERKKQQRRRQQQQQQQRAYWQRQQQQRRQQQQQQQQQQQFASKPTKDYYKILGVKRNADEETIKKAYREQMRQNHPDKLKRTSNLSEEQIESKVADINNAYEILSDPDQRKKYDQFGEDPSHQGGAPPPQQQFRRRYPSGGNWRFQRSGNSGADYRKYMKFFNGASPGGGFNFNFGQFGDMFKQGMNAGKDNPFNRAQNGGNRRFRWNNRKGDKRQNRGRA